VEILQEFAARKPERRPKKIHLRFLVSPVELSGDGKVEQITIGRNELVADDSGALRAKDTGGRETLDCGLVLRSVGYRGVPIDGLPFDERRGVIPNEAGRVLDADGGRAVGQYAAGWIKRGPSGVIGTNKKDAQETVDSLVADLEAGSLPDPPSLELSAVEELLAERGVDHVTYAGWSAIDRAEVDRGKPHGRPRVKFVHIEEMLEAAAAEAESTA
jgi:ferredoxin--NADP+ reductase